MHQDGIFEKVQSWADLVRLRAQLAPHAQAFVFLEDGETPGPALTYSELLARSEAVAGALRRYTQPGDRVVLVFAPGIDFIVAFHACIFAGVIAVPTFPPEPRRLQQSMARVRSIVADCRPAVLLGHALFRDVLAPLGAWLDWETLGTDAAPALAPHPLAFLQYTSGSTAAPRGVMVTHANLLHNSSYIYAVQGNHLPSVGCTWLPSYHDMGLIEGLLQPLYGGFPCYFMSPLSFLEQPRRWLQAITRYGVTSSGGPNFGYELCCRRIGSDIALDLGSWRVAYNGAEPIRAQTLHRFLAKFSPAGLRATSLYPVYGMAEATLMISSGSLNDEPVELCVDPVALASNQVLPSPTGKLLVGAGRVGAQMEVVIVEAGVATDGVGEIWLRGASVAAGYFEKPEATAETFAAHLNNGEGPFLRTGDLGFLRAGELFVVGRRKDLIIVRGANHHPSDLEQTVEHADEAIRPGGVAAVAIERNGEEALGLAIELKTRDDAARVEASVRAQVGKVHGLDVAAIVFLDAGALPKTLSGKLQRNQARELFKPVTSAPVAHTGWRRAARAFLLERLGELLGRAAQMHEAPSALGLDSLAVISLKGELQDAFECRFDIDKLFDATTLGAGIDAMLLAAQKQSSTPRLGEQASDDETGLWVWQQSQPTSHAFDIEVALLAPLPFDETRLRSAFSALAQRHETMRTSFVFSAGQVRRRLSPAALPFCSGPLADEPFVLTDAPPWRAALDGAVLRLRFHHIGFDLVAITTLLGELEQLNHGAQLPPAPQPSERPISAAPDEAYWRASFARPAQRLLLPKTDARLQVGEVPFSGQFSQVLSAIVSALARYGNDEGFWIGVSTLGRPPAFAQCVASFSSIAPLYVPPGIRSLSLEQIAQHVSVSLSQVVSRHDVSRHRWSTYMPHALAGIDVFVHYRQLPPGLPAAWNDALRGDGALRIFDQTCQVTTARGSDPRTAIELDVTLAAGVCRLSGDSAPLVQLALATLKDGEVAHRERGESGRRQATRHEPLHALLAAATERMALCAPQLQMSEVVLSAHAAKWAAYLRERGLGRGEVCCFYVEPSLQVVPAFLGALLCGAKVAFVNVEWPTPRTLAFLQALRPKLCVRHTQNSMRFPIEWPALSLTDELAQVEKTVGALGTDSETAALLTLRGQDVQQVSITEVQARAYAWGQALELSDDLLTVAEPPWHPEWAFAIITALQCRQRLYVAPLADLGCPGWLVEHMRDIGITRYTASAFRMRHLLNDLVSPTERLPHVKTWIIRHGPRTRDLQAKIAKYFPRDTVRVSYGSPLPATLGPLTDDPRSAGTSLEGVVLEIVDDMGEPVPAGAEGHIAIAGKRSGDRGWLNLDGALFLADADPSFVDVKGERVSVPFVQGVLNAAPGITGARVVAKKDAAEQWQLAAYAQTALKPQDIRRALQASLVPAEAPASIDIVADINSPLPEPIWRMSSLHRGPSPTSASEKRVADWFVQVIGVSPTSIDDDFFMLGGDSMLMLKLLSLMNDAGVAITLAELRQAPSVRALALRLV